MLDIHTQIMFSLRTPPLMCESVFVCELRVRYHGWRLYPGRQSKEIIPLIHTHTHHFKNYNFFSNGNKVWLLLKMSSQDTPGEMCIFMMCITSYFSSFKYQVLKWFFRNWIRAVSHNWLRNTSTAFSAQMLSKNHLAKAEDELLNRKLSYWQNSSLWQ